MKYLCLVYHDESRLETVSPSTFDALVDETLAYTEEIQRSGHVLDSHALEFVHTATSIRVRDGKAHITDGPYVETKEQLGGYLLIEARDLNDAIRLASKMPQARWGGIEIRPIKDLRSA